MVEPSTHPDGKSPISQSNVTVLAVSGEPRDAMELGFFRHVFRPCAGPFSPHTPPVFAHSIELVLLAVLGLVVENRFLIVESD